MLFNLGDLVDRAQDPNAPALIDCLDWARPAHYSHRDMDRLACAVASGLKREGFAAGARIGILSANRAEFLAAYFGIMRAGLVAVPINHKFPPATIEFVLRDADIRLVFCDSARRVLLPPGVRAVDFDAQWPSMLGAPEFDTVRPGPHAIAMILYTSGSTGRPKGVPLDHAGHLWTVRSRLAAGSFRDHRLLVAAPLFHMNALGTSKFVFAAHASMVLLPQFDARRYLEAIERFRVTWATSVPTMLAMVVRETATLARTDVSSVRTVRMGSAPITQKLIDDVRRAFPGATVLNAYGTTEAGPVMFGPAPDGREKPDLALGWPLPGVEVRLVDAQGRDADEGVLWIRTPANMTGYLNLPDKTREVLTPEGWYISGDVFRRDAEGAYYFVGRSDDMFVCGGENIYPGEVEHLLEAHPDIVQACVVAVPDEIKGAKPFAFVVPRPGAQLGEDDVKRYALANAPAYQHPRQVVFMPELPLAGTNKVDRKALGELALTHWRGGDSD
ncbi:MAG: acyl--CoA ligase [Burkholderiales bacterium]|nr:acyl--CoA ligase [Burkholderiales bacterium]